MKSFVTFTVDAYANIPKSSIVLQWNCLRIFLSMSDRKSNSIAKQFLNMVTWHFIDFKVYIFWGGHKILRNLHHLFFICQIIDGDFTKFCGLLRIYELYKAESNHKSAS